LISSGRTPLHIGQWVLSMIANCSTSPSVQSRRKRKALLKYAFAPAFQLTKFGFSCSGVARDEQAWGKCTSPGEPVADVSSAKREGDSSGKPLTGASPFEIGW